MKVLIIILLVGVAFGASTPPQISDPIGKPGGLMAGAVHDVENIPDDEVKGIIKKVTPDITRKIGESKGKDAKAAEPYETLAYKTQIVAGRNYFVKVRTNEGEIWHIRIYRDISDNLSVDGVSGPKREEENIKHFQSE